MWKSELRIRQLTASISARYRGKDEPDDETILSGLKEALRKHYADYGKIDAPNEQNNVYEVFRLMPVVPPYSADCKRIIEGWRGQYGEFNGPTALRTLLKEADKGGRDALHIKALKDRATLHSCGHDIVVPSGLLFRGTGREGQIRAEEFTATSMSFRAATNYIVPVMIIYIPDRRVRGLVIRNIDPGQDEEDDDEMGTDTDAEILLLNPKLVKCSDTMRNEIVEFILDNNLGQSTLKVKPTKPLEAVQRIVEVWVYQGSSPTT